LKSRRSARQRPPGGATIPWLLAVLAVPLLALVFAAAPASAATLCIAEPEVKGCIQGTIGDRANPIAGVDVILTGPDGTQTVSTTEDDGKYSFEVTESGDYLIGVDSETLPEGVAYIPPTGALLGEGDTFKVSIDLTNAKKLSVAPNLNIGPAATAGPSTLDRVLQSGFNGLRLGLLLALASVGLSLIYGTTGISNFAHAE
jgi:neutral amino acid transport system permease protein